MESISREKLHKWVDGCVGVTWGSGSHGEQCIAIDNHELLFTFASIYSSRYRVFWPKIENLAYVDQRKVTHRNI